MLGCIVDGSANSAGELIDQLQKAQRMEEARRQSVARRDHRLVLTPHGFMDVDDQQLEAKRTARNR